MKLNEKKLLYRYKGLIQSPQDLTAGEPPATLFPILSRVLFRSMNLDPEIAIKKKDVIRSRNLHWIIKTFGKSFLKSPQFIERSITLPEEPVIFVSNHAFRDDILATILAAKRHAYIMLGSLPAIHNSFDGFTAWLNGSLLINRKVKASKASSIEKALRILRFGSDLVVFPEGVWNKTPNKLLIDFWSGVYAIAVESGAKIVPVVHYVRECEKTGKDNPIHTVICDPICIGNMQTKEFLEHLRIIMATTLYDLMDQYGHTTHEDALEHNPNSISAWESKLEARIKPAGRYDTEIETTAHYRPSFRITPDIVWTPVADIIDISLQNASHVAYAKTVVEEYACNDFQSRF